MPRGDDVGSHDQNGSRNYLADEVQAQRKDITDLVGAVAGLREVVRDLVEDAREERKSAKEERGEIVKQLYAQRSEQQQLSMGLTDVQGKMAAITKTLGEIDGERRDAKTILSFVSKSAKTAWTLFGAAIATMVAWLWKHWPAAGGVILFLIVISTAALAQH